VLACLARSEALGLISSTTHNNCQPPPTPKKKKEEEEKEKTLVKPKVGLVLRSVYLFLRLPEAECPTELDIGSTNRSRFFTGKFKVVLGESPEL
jgi:hypothetical protein